MDAKNPEPTERSAVARHGLAVLLTLVAVGLRLIIGHLFDSTRRLCESLRAARRRERDAWKQTEDALRESELRLRLAVEHLGMATWDTDLSTGKSVWSESHFRLLGYDPAPDGKGTFEMWASRVHPGDRDRVLAAFDRARDQHRLFAASYRVVRADDGQTRWLTAFGQFLRDGGGNAVRSIGVEFDDTVRKEAEERLRESEEKYRTLFESIDEGVTTFEVVFDENDRAVDLIFRENNRAFTEMTGLPADVIGKRTSVVVPNLERFWIETYEQVVKTGVTRRFEHESPAVGRWFDVHASWAGGRQVVLVYRDITARKRTEERQAFLLKLSDALRAGPDADAVTSRALRMLSGHLRLDRCYVGVYRPADDRADLTHQVGNDRVPPLPDRIRLSDFPAALRVATDRTLVIDDVAATEGLSDTDRRNIAALGLRALVAAGLREGEGNLLWTIVAVSATPRGWTRDEVALIEEVTERTWAAVERTKAEAALRQSEERFRQASDAAGAMVYEVDLTGRWPGHVHGLEQVTGYDPAAVPLDRGWWNGLVHPDDLADHLAAVARQLAEGGVRREVYRSRHADGSWRWVEDTAELVRDAAGAAVRLVGAIVDVTDRKRAEEALREADRQKDVFLATLAHELRNPLAPIRNGLQVMRLAGGDAGAVEKSRSMMERQIEQMTRLIDDLMDVSRISRGKIILQKTRVPLAAAVQNAVDASRPLMQKQDHELTVHVPDEPIFVDGDGTRLTQVFANLLDNAAKYTSRGGRIRLLVEQKGSDAVVAVEDNGVGIPAPMLGKVFDMFSQVDRSLEKSQGGLGIGLHIVKRLVEKHNGSIQVESDGHGMGSRFTVRLPVWLGSAADVEDRPVAKVASTRRRILVVDDNADGAASLAMMLDIMGNETQVAHDGLAAIATAETFRPDVILMDIGMPKLNGYDACRRIREQPWGRGIVMVAQTGWGQDEDRQKSQEAGFNFHLVKPVDPAALEKMLAVSTAPDPRRPRRPASPARP